MDNNNAVVPQENHQFLWNERKQKYEVIDLKTGKLVPSTQELAKQYAPESAEYTPYMADMVLAAIREGRSLQELKADNRFPPLHAIQMWKAINPDFKRRLDQAYKDRAEHYHDKALEIALEAAAAHKDAVPGMKLAVSTLQWAAERGNPDKYNGKAESSGKGGGVTIIIDTGVQSEGTTNINIDVGDDGEFRGFINEQTHRNGGTANPRPEREGRDEDTIELTADRWSEIPGDTTGEKSRRAVRTGDFASEEEACIPPIPQTSY